jgi:Long-chain acyl-CoA synthetases (AMP-forming)
VSDANILPVDCQSFPQLMARNAKRFGGEPAYREKEFGIWQTWTWAEALAETREIALGLMGIGLEPGDRVAIIGSNRVELYLSMIATQMAGGVPVPLYQDSVAEEMAYVVEHCGAKFAVVEDQEQVDKCIEIKEKVSSLHDVIYVNPRGLRKYDHTHLKSLENVREIGHAFTDVNASKMDERIAAETEHDTCVMLYTSGTTGKPKGVCAHQLQHHLDF